METFKIYLAGPVKYEDDGGTGWREKATEIIRQATNDLDIKVRVFDPTKYFTYDEVSHQSDTQVKKYYLDQILHSNIILCNLTRTTTSPGTAEELQYAVDHDVQIIGFGDEEVYPWLKVDCQCTFPSMLQAIDYIVDYYLR